MAERACSFDLGVGEGDIEEFSEVPEGLTTEGLLAKEESRGKETVGGEEPSKTSTVKDLAESSADPNKFPKNLKNMDSNTKRFSLTEKNVPGAPLAYETICDANRKRTRQTTMEMFLKRVTPPQGEPQAGPSGDAPEGGTAVTAPRVVLPPKAVGGTRCGGDDGHMDDTDLV